MEWNPEDFEKLKFNPYGLPFDTTVVKTFHELAVRPAFTDVVSHTGVSRDKVQRWILFVYQQNSPLLTINTPLKRKIEAAKLARFPMLNDEAFTPEYKDVIMGQNTYANSMVIDFCRLQRNPDFSELMVYEDSFYKELENLQTNDDPMNRQRILANMKVLKERINTLRMSLLHGDENDTLFAQVMKEVELERLELSREDIAFKLATGENPLPKVNPYGKEYSFVRSMEKNKSKKQKSEDQGSEAEA